MLLMRGPSAAHPEPARSPAAAPPCPQAARQQPVDGHDFGGAGEPEKSSYVVSSSHFPLSSAFKFFLRLEWFALEDVRMRSLVSALTKARKRAQNMGVRHTFAPSSVRLFIRATSHVGWRYCATVSAPLVTRARARSEEHGSRSCCSPVLLLRGRCAARPDLDPPPPPRSARRHLNSNLLTGTIPAALASLTNLQQL